MISRSVAVKRAPKLKEYIKLNRVGIKNIYSVCIIDGNSRNAANDSFETWYQISVCMLYFVVGADFGDMHNLLHYLEIRIKCCNRDNKR